MSQWGSAKARRVLAALLRIGNRVAKCRYRQDASAIGDDLGSLLGGPAVEDFHIIHRIGIVEAGDGFAIGGAEGVEGIAGGFADGDVIGEGVGAAAAVTNC